MQIRLTLGALAVAAFAANCAIAQTSSSGAMAPAGQGPGTGASTAAGMADTPNGSTKSRAMVKLQTRQAQAAGTTRPAGESVTPPSDPDMKEGKPMMNKGANTTRGDVKAQTKAAKSNGMMKPAGEAPTPVAEPSPK